MSYFLCTYHLASCITYSSCAHATFLYHFSMPASSAIDSKDRIMGGGVSAVARRKGAVHRLAESWDIGD